MKPDAAESIPKKALLAEEDLKNKQIIKNKAVDERLPKRMIKKLKATSDAVMFISPMLLMILRPTVKISDVTKNADITDAQKYANIICHLLIGVAEMS